jgi:hypothetical protein
MDSVIHTQDIKTYLSLATKEMELESNKIVADLTINGTALDLLKQIIKTELYQDLLDLHGVDFDGLMQENYIKPTLIAMFVDIVKTMFLDNISLFNKVSDKPFYKLIFLGALPLTPAPELVKYCTSN